MVTGSNIRSVIKKRNEASLYYLQIVSINNILFGLIRCIIKGKTNKNTNGAIFLKNIETKAILLESKSILILNKQYSKWINSKINILMIEIL